MPVAAFAPNRIHTDYSEWTAPGIAYNGQVWAWNNATGKYEPTALAFDPAGTAATAISMHLAAGNPHGQYLLASGVSVFGATLIDDADASAGQTTLGLGTAAVLNVGTSANSVVQLNGSGQLPAVDGSLLTGISGGSVAGSTTQVIFNDAGAFAGDAGLTYAKATDRLTVAGGLVAPSMRPASNGTSALGWFDASGTQFVYGDTTNLRFGLGVIPVRRLHVYENVNGASAMRFENPNSGSSASAGIEMMNDTSNYGMLRVGSSAFSSGFEAIKNRLALDTVLLSGTDAGLSIVARGTTDVRFYVGGPATANEVARFAATTGYLALGQTTPTALLDLAASTTARASLRIRSGTAPTSPNDGDVWFDGTIFKCRIGGVTKTFTVT